MPDRIVSEAPELKSSHYPYMYDRRFMQSDDTLWLRVTPKTFRPNVSIQKGINSEGIRATRSLHFLLGKSLALGVNHTWSELTTISGAIRDVKSTFEKQFADLSGFANASGAFNALGIKFNNMFAGGRGTKNDAPFIYENSDRLSFQVELNFVAHRDSEDEVWNPIQSLMVWSCASKKSGGVFDTQFSFPYVFHVETVTGSGKKVGLINFTDAAITSVLPTYNEPYKNGYPMSAQVQLTFTDINPTYRENLSNNGKSRISVGLESGQDDLTTEANPNGLTPGQGL